MIQGPRDQRGLGAFGVDEVPPSMTPALGMDEAVDRLNKALVDEVAIGQQDSTEAAQRLPHHRAGTRGRKGKGDFILLLIDGPEAARVQLACAAPPGFDGGLIHRQHGALQNRG